MPGPFLILTTLRRLNLALVLDPQRRINTIQLIGHDPLKLYSIRQISIPLHVERLVRQPTPTPWQLPERILGFGDAGRVDGQGFKCLKVAEERVHL